MVWCLEDALCRNCSMQGLRCAGATVFEYYAAWKMHSVMFVGNAISESWE